MTATKRLGFWIDERDIWSGGGLNWTPQQFFNNYFDTPPYPSAMLWSTGLNPSGPYEKGVQGEITWLNELASICDAKGLKILLLFFVNLSGSTVNGQIDQTQVFTDFMNSIKGHSSIVGAEYEREYFGNTLQEKTIFRNIVKNAGYTNIVGRGDLISFPSDPVLDYSTYPSYNGSIISTVYKNSIGVGYGETGGGEVIPVWTQETVSSIINSSAGNPFVLIYADRGAKTQSQRLWDDPVLRGWIWTDTQYQSNFILSTNSPPPPPPPPPNGNFFFLVSGLSFDSFLSWINSLSPSQKTQIESLTGAKTTFLIQVNKDGSFSNI